MMTVVVAGSLLDNNVINHICYQLNVMSVLAEETTADSGMPFLSVKSPFCAQFASVSGGIASCGHRPTKGDFIDMLSRACHTNLIPFLSSYAFSNLIHIFLKTSSLTHFWNRLWQVEPEPYSLGSIFHWHPVLRTYMTPSITFLNGTIGRPTAFWGFSLDKTVATLSHNSPGVFVIVCLRGLWTDATI